LYTTKASIKDENSCANNVLMAEISYAFYDFMSIKNEYSESITKT